MNSLAQLATASSSPPAGGAAIGQVILATAFAGGGTALLVHVVNLHRRGRTEILQRAADMAERLGGIPGWAALPLGISGASLLAALFGVYWDVSIHIDQGRDPGPLANPAHYFILLGLFGIFASGYLSISLPRNGERPGPAAVRIAGNWYAPVGGLLMLITAAFALIGFPLDDLWHRLFGQDVTLWGPTHLMLIGGAVMTLVGMSILIVEGTAERRARGNQGPAPVLQHLRKVGLAGGLLIGLTVFQAEFDFGVPQFRLIFEPILLAFSAGFALVFARVWLGRGGALYALAFYLGARAIIALLVADVLGQSTPYFPIYLAEALCIELAAFFLGRDRPLRLAVVCGFLVGTVGLAAEWGWSHVWMPVPFTENILPAAAIVAPIAGVAGALGGALLACALRGQLPEPRLTRRVFGGAIATMVALCIFGLHTTQPDNLRATITLDRTKSDPGQGIATVRFDPPAAADGAAWVRETAWQGGGLVQAPLDRVGEGIYRTPDPLPLTGDWKSVIRLQTGTAIEDVPVYMPADPAIPVGAVPARHQVTRQLQPTHEVLQRELKPGIPSWLWTLAASLVMAFWLVMIVLIGIGAGRAGRQLAIASGDERSSDSQPTSRRRSSSSAAAPPRRPKSRFA
jgi:hypothetical protein